ncbi:MAG: DUF21 domain-containing protein [Planctomycetota bacterium]|nr:MAG: DUF21 domain-containing protein [Planctomycetota bacterium]REJ87381.1 MAG: DUF21 domain-containing protein [Planctomycetota bacterium]REK27318.1 MAG: DUF21 domain-containing protein [Planctomycetota bacterium]REK36661.1 MAG: DUF21 domain-containing protein [Planctomycetota bacterium]
MNEFLAAAPLWLPGVTTMACLILASAFFSGSETALFYLSRDEVQALHRGGARERLVAGLLADSDRLLTAILFWNLLINLTYFAVSVVTARHLISRDYSTVAGALSVLSVAAIIVFGEVIPKATAVTFRRSIAVIVSIPLAMAVRLVDPFLPLLVGSARTIRRILWPNLKQEPFLDVGDLERAIETSNLGADLIRHERQALQNIIELSDITCEEVMRPRGTYTVWPPPVHLADIRGRLLQTDRLYIGSADQDDISASVALDAFNAFPDLDLQASATPVVHVPWCATLSGALEQMQERGAGVAVVINEYGETIGVVNDEDIVDTMLSPQPSRARRVLRREPVLEVAPGLFHVDGITTLRYLAHRLQLPDEPAPDGVLTVAGLLHETLERLPAVGDEFSWQGWVVRVIDAESRGAVRVMFSREQTPDPQPEVEADNARLD